MDRERPLLWVGVGGRGKGKGEGEVRSCERRLRTRRSVLTPTVSRKLTGLRSRMMALGRDGSGGGLISMTVTCVCSPISVAPSCEGGEIAQVQSDTTSKSIENHNNCKNQVYDTKRT